MPDGTPGVDAPAGALRAVSPPCLSQKYIVRPNSHGASTSPQRLPLSPTTPFRVSTRAQSARLSSRAYSAKVQWEAIHGEPCPYAHAAAPLHVGREERKRLRGPPAATRNNNSNRHGGLLPAGVPDSQQQYCGFGSGFYKNPRASVGQPRSSYGNAERETAVDAAAVSAASTTLFAVHAGVAGARRRGKIAISGGDRPKAKVRTGRRTRAAPTLLEMHQRVIDAALREISQPRERPFENLGERLGGEHNTFTYCSHDDDGRSSGGNGSNDGGGAGGVGGDRGTESMTCGPDRLPEFIANTKKRRASARKRTAAVKTRDRPRPHTRPQFRTQTVDEPHQPTVLPQFNTEPWKIPLLRTSWTPSDNGSRSITGDSFGDLEDVSPDSELSGSHELEPEEQPRPVAAEAAEDVDQSTGATGEAVQPDGVTEQCLFDIIPSPQSESSPAYDLASVRVPCAAAEQYIEETISDALQASVRATFDKEEVCGRAAPAIAAQSDGVTELCTDNIQTPHPESNAIPASEFVSGSHQLQPEVQPCAAAARHPEDVGRSTGATALVAQLDGVTEQCLFDIAPSPLSESNAAHDSASVPITRTAAEQYIEKTVSDALQASLPAGVVHEDTRGRENTNRDAASSLFGASVADASVSRTAATQYVEETMAHVIACGRENPSLQSATKTPHYDVSLMKEVAVAKEASAIAYQCSQEYLRQGLARSSKSGTSGFRTEEGTDDMLSACLPDKLAKQNNHDTLGLEFPGVVTKDYHISDGSGATTPMSDSTTPMSSDSSAIEFVLDNDPSIDAGKGSHHVANQQVPQAATGTGVGSSYPTAAVAIAAATMVEEWVSGVVVGASAHPSRTPSPAAVEASPALNWDQIETLRVKEDIACDGEPSVCIHSVAPGGDQNQQHQGFPSGVAMRALPLGFLEEIVQRRASLKPVRSSRPTSASAEEEQNAIEHRERLAEREASDRTEAIRVLEALVRAEGLNRYDSESFSRGGVLGEGRHSAVYSAYATRVCGGTSGEEHRDSLAEVATTEVAAKESAAAAVARQASAEVLAAAVAAGIIMKAASSAAMVPAIFAEAVIDVVIPASISTVVAATTTLGNSDTSTSSALRLAAKEFRYARTDAPVSILRQVHREVSMHLRVAGHAQVVAIRGVWLTPRVTILLEPMDGGNLHRFVRTRAAAEDNVQKDTTTDGCTGEGVKRRQRTHLEAAWLVAEAADGLAALHDAGIVHRDVKSQNILVVQRQRSGKTKAAPAVSECGREYVSDDGGVSYSGCAKSEWEAKLGDLGSATLVPPEGEAALTEAIGTNGWTAPEVFEGQGYGKPADVFSLGVVIWDTFVCGVLDNPLCGLLGEARQLREGLRPPWPRRPQPTVPPDIERLAECCWATEPEDRPTAGAVSAKLLVFARAAVARTEVDVEALETGLAGD